MVEKISKFYRNRTLFIVSSALTVCCYLVDAIQATVNGNISDYAWIFLGLVLLLQWAYFKGEINVQKMLFGALLLYMIDEQCELMRLNAEYAGGGVLFIDVIVLICSIVIFLSHMYQQMDHRGRNLAVLINQLLGFVAVIFLLSAISNVIYDPSMFVNYVFVFGYVFNCIMVICMETRVDTYKQIRDKARAEGTWTEEARKEAKKLFKFTEC